jgi:hypothetical protein
VVALALLITACLLLVVVVVRSRILIITTGGHILVFSRGFMNVDCSGPVAFVMAFDLQNKFLL